MIKCNAYISYSYQKERMCNMLELEENIRKLNNLKLKLHDIGDSL